MVSLVVEEVHERGLERMSIPPARECSVLDVRHQQVFGQASAEVLDRGVGRVTLAAQILEFGEQLLIERANRKPPRP